MGKYSKLIGALVGNLVAIALAYIATRLPDVAECTVTDSETLCRAFGFTQVEITAFLMAILNTVFVYAFPPNKDTTKALAMLAIMILPLTALAACQTTPEQAAAVEQAYERTCAVEPALYQTFVTVATTRQASEKTLQKAVAVHQSMIALCTDRPKDIFSASVQVANLYAQLVAISAQVERNT